MSAQAAVLMALMSRPKLHVIAWGRTTTGTIDVSALGARVGDLIGVFCYTETGSGTFSVSGSGWTEADGYSTGGGLYTGGHAFKFLTDLTSISVGGFSFEAIYFIARGPAAAALVYGPNDSNADPRTVVFPTPAAEGYGSIIVTAQQGGADLAPPAGYIDHGLIPGASFTYNLFTLAPASSSAHNDVLTGTTGSVAMVIWGFEVRR